MDGQINSDDIICNILKVGERVAAIALSCLEHLPHGEMLTELGLLRLEKAQGTQSPVVPSDRTGDNGPGLKHGKFHLNIRKTVLL